MSAQQTSGTDAAIAWQGASGEKWVRLQAATDAQLAPLGLLALQALALAQGEQVLDVGCGAGQTLLQLAGRVGPSGRVVGLDISPPLVARARQLVADRADVEVVLGDAATHPFSGGFDAIFSRFGVMFFSDPAQAFSNLVKALKPGGRLSFVCWQALEQNPWAHLLLTAVQRVAPSHELPEMLTPEQPGPFRFADTAFVLTMLANAGFIEGAVEAHDTQVQFGGASDLGEAVDYALQIGPAARFVTGCDSSLLPEFRVALGEALSPFLVPAGVVLPARTLVFTARR